MLFDERHTLRDLHERFPDPPRELVVGDPPLLHHGYAFGSAVVVIKALKECMEIAKGRGDTAATDHLRAHLKAYEEWRTKRDRHRAAADSAHRQRPGRIAPPAPSLP